MFYKLVQCVPIMYMHMYASLNVFKSILTQLYNLLVRLYETDYENTVMKKASMHSTTNI